MCVGGRGYHMLMSRSFRGWVGGGEGARELFIALHVDDVSLSSFINTFLAK